MATQRDIQQRLAQEYAIAWSSGNPDAVAEFFAEDCECVINRDRTFNGRDGIREMVSGFLADFPDLEVRCDLLRTADSHALFVWTLEGHHVRTGNHVAIGGWEEWELEPDLKIRASEGWFDAIDFQRQIDGL